VPPSLLAALSLLVAWEESLSGLKVIIKVWNTNRVFFKWYLDTFEPIFVRWLSLCIYYLKSKEHSAFGAVLVSFLVRAGAQTGNPIPT
jgi:hypothetical protein